MPATRPTSGDLGEEVRKRARPWFPRGSEALRHSDRPAAPKQQQLVAAGLDAQHRFQVERLALVFLPYRLRHDYVSGRRVAQFALDSRSVAVEVKKQRGRVVVEAIQKERLATPDRAVDLRRGRLKRLARASGGLVARQVEKIENYQAGT